MANTTFRVRPMERTKQGGMIVKVTVWEPLNVPLRLTITSGELRFEPETPDQKGAGTKAAEMAARTLASMLGAGGAAAAMRRSTELNDAASFQFLQALDGGGFTVATDQVRSAEVKGIGGQHRVHLSMRTGSDEFVFQPEGGRRNSEAALSAVRAVL
jgi:hypothetical protein